MSLINISNLTFSHNGGYDTIFDDVSFQIDTDWKLGFTGRNGRGKTTFMHLLCGKYEYSGIISAPCGFEYFPYETPDKTLNTFELVETVCPNLLHWELVRELSLLSLDEEVLYRPFDTLSNGEQTKILLAVLFLKKDRFLLIDEPTNHLDMHGRAVVRAYLNRKKGFILVSHDRAFLDGCIDHILSINKTNIEIQRGNFTSWLVNKERQDSFELAENEKLKKNIRHLSDAAKRTSDWSDKAEKTKYATKNSGLRPDRGYVGHKAANMMKRSKGIEARRKTAAEEKSRLLKNLEDAETLKITQPTYHTNRFVTLDGVSILYGKKIACQNVSFSVEQGDRIALCGGNGSGKSSILKLICGESITHTGRFQKGSRLNISYISQDTSFLSGKLSDYARQKNLDESLFKTILRKLDFSRTQFETNMEDFSGGQKKKVLIAESLCTEAHLLIWDEPLNFIDITSRMQIETLLITHKPTILFVEHDRVFCDQTATKKIEI